MELVLDRPTTTQSVETNEAQKHNAQIKERYLKLQSAEADQFAAPSHVAPTYQATTVNRQESTVYAPMFGSTPTVEQTPQVTEYVRHMESALFTAEKFEKMENEAPQTTTPTFVADVTSNAPVMTTATATATREGYSLNSFAKFMLGVFATVVVCSMTMICVNTAKIQQKTMRLKNLEEKRQELVEKNEEIERRIADAKSEETIRQYAESQGMVQLGQ